jgi:hypothetical protein
MERMRQRNLHINSVVYRSPDIVKTVTLYANSLKGKKERSFRYENITTWDNEADDGKMAEY